MSNIIRVLLIDDNPKDCESVVTRAQLHNMIVYSFSDGKGAFDELKENPHYYHALIFDANCVWDNNRKNVAEDTFLGTAIIALERLEKERHNYYPMVVYTGFAEDFQSQQETVEKRGGKIFEKGSEIKSKEMLTFLRNKVENLEEWIYKDVFEIFNLDYFDNNLRPNLKEIIKNMGKEVAIHDNFTAIRKILEEMYRRIRAKDANLLPVDLGLNLEAIWVYLSGRPTKLRNPERTLPAVSPLLLPHESAFVKAIEETTSANSHSYLGTSYAYKSVVFALLEQLLWFKKLMQTT